MPKLIKSTIAYSLHHNFYDSSTHKVHLPALFKIYLLSLRICQSISCLESVIIIYLLTKKTHYSPPTYPTYDCGLGTEKLQLTLYFEKRNGSGERRNNREKETIPNIQTTKNVLARFRLLAGKDFYNFFSKI